MIINKSYRLKNYSIPRTVWFLLRKRDKLIGIRSLFNKCNVADCDRHEGNQNCSYRETTLRQESWSTFVNNLPEVLDNQGFDAKIDMNSSSNEPSSTWVEFTNETLLEGIKPFFREMYESDYRQEWTKSKNFWLLRVSGFQCRKLDKLKAIRASFSKCNLADCDSHEGNQNCSFRETALR